MRGQYVAPELVKEQTLENLARFSDRLQAAWDRMQGAKESMAKTIKKTKKKAKPKAAKKPAKKAKAKTKARKPVKKVAKKKRRSVAECRAAGRALAVEALQAFNEAQAATTIPDTAVTTSVPLVPNPSVSGIPAEFYETPGPADPDGKARQIVSENRGPVQFTCGVCETPMGDDVKLDDVFCHGCNKHIHEGCDKNVERVGMGRTHSPKQHGEEHDPAF